ncbi:MAG: PepSY-like domain-containing protein [Imperialibacter sp.]|uniref:PepSY-like domain-containing protein n=1 Tax=Imperialibacter roseus TaxID=1324217 RepID=A0ABZ0ISW9_9BACT|nr:PepSY-like domain-containing protein [Imperialibacter roseus]WOK07229.1 PepSY-like domain-containing protein [Imperialibacter roseus]
MRNLKNLPVLILSLLMVACSPSNKKTPTTVKTAFEKRFSKATDVEWSMENETEWEAEFELGGKEYSANFSVEGVWMETEHEIEEAEVPVRVKNTLDSAFAGYMIEAIEMTESPTGAAYEFLLEKGLSDIEVVISSVGKVVKTEVIKEDGMDDDGQ